MSLEMPNYYDYKDRMLYEKLERESSERELTPTEHRFCVSMYHMEEYASGLDGDREPVGPEYPYHDEDGWHYDDEEDEYDDEGEYLYD